jgi:hypothetical protein
LAFAEIETERRRWRGLLPLAGALATVLLGGSAAAMGVAGIVDFLSVLAAGETKRWDFQAVAFVLLLMAGLVGAGGLSSVFGIKALWHCLVASILRRHARIGR